VATERVKDYLAVSLQSGSEILAPT